MKNQVFRKKKTGIATVFDVVKQSFEKNTKNILKKMRRTIAKISLPDYFVYGGASIVFFSTLVLATGIADESKGCIGAAVGVFLTYVGCACEILSEKKVTKRIMDDLDAIQSKVDAMPTCPMKIKLPPQVDVPTQK